MDRGSLPPFRRSLAISRLIRAAVGLTVGFVASCGGGTSSGSTGPTGGGAVLSAVRISLSSSTIQVGQSEAASATGLDQNGATISIGTPAWSSTSPDVATVSASGVVSGVGAGQTILTASVNGKQGQLSLTVLQIQIASLSIAPRTPTMARGATLQLTATALDGSGNELTGRRLDWTSSDPAKAAVTSTGVVTAVAAGVATIVATGDGINASAVVTVTDAVGSLATVTVSPSDWTLSVGDSVQLDASLKDAAGNNLTGSTVSWKSSVLSGGTVATVSGAGLVRAVSPGTMVVTASGDGQSGTATITVLDVMDPSIVVTFGSPSLDQVFGDSVHVVVDVQSINPLVGASAVIGPFRATLDRTPAGARGTAILWTAWIKIVGLHAGPNQVVVTATDILGAHGVGTIRFQYDAKKGEGVSSPPMK